MRGSSPSLRRLCVVGLALTAGPFLRAALADADDPPPPRRPNVVFLYTDDQARWTVGAYGNRQARTPNMDRLAREGATVRNAFTVTPVCSPSRAGMFASRYPTQVGITDWINVRVEPEIGLDPSVLTWPEILRGHGYATGLFGKWHLGDWPRFHPTRNGYDLFLGFHAGGTRPIDPVLEVDGKTGPVKGSLPDILVDGAIRFIEEHRDRPFLVSVHFRAPHAPYAPVPEIDSAPFRDLDPTIPDWPGLPVDRVKGLTREYYASIHSVDRNIGRLLDRLDALGLTGNTLVVFTSDHGYMIGHHGLWHKGNASWIQKGKSGRRPNMFEPAIRVPLLVRFPGVVPAGSTVEATVSNLDHFPTVLDLVGQGVPENLRIEGRSAADLLRGRPAAARDDTLFGQYDMKHGATAHMRMIRRDGWKLVRHFESGGEDELYHLAADPEETRNLAASSDHRPTFESLDRGLRDKMRSIGDPLADRWERP